MSTSDSNDIGSPKSGTVGIKRSLDGSDVKEKLSQSSSLSPPPLNGGRERKQITNRYVPEDLPTKTPSSNKRARPETVTVDKKAIKLEEKEREIIESKTKIEKLKIALAKAEEKKVIKFPIKDELIKELDKKGKEPLKIPEPTTKIHSLFADDIVAVWDFLNTFQKQLALPSIEIDDFIELMEYTGKESVALTELFLAPLRIILLDEAYVAKVTSALPNLSFCRKPDSQKEINIKEKYNQKLPNFSIKSIVNKDDGSVDKLVAEGFDSAFNGLQLLPRKLSPNLIHDHLKWQTVLRAILLRDPSIRDIRNDIHKLFLEYENVKKVVYGSKKKARDDAVEGGGHDYQSCVAELNKYAAHPVNSRGGGKKNRSNLLNHDLFLRLTSDPFAVLENVIAAAQALETKEIHELSFRNKISILKVLCEACFDTQFIRDELATNIEERANRITANRKRLEEKKREQREIANGKRDDAIKLCWQANKLAAEAKAVKGKKKNPSEAVTASPSKKSASPKKSGGSKAKTIELPSKKDAHYPKQDQINAMIEELALLDTLEIDKVVDDLEVEEVSDDEDDNITQTLDFTDDGPKQKSRATIRSKAGEKKLARQEKRARNIQITMANEALNRALETHTEKDIKAAIKLAQKAGFEGEDDDGQIFCTQSLKQVYKLKHELEIKSAEEAEYIKQDKAMSEFVCRSEPIGKDRHFNEYWAFKGDNRLFVRSKVTSDKNVEKDKLTHLAAPLAAANSTLNKIYQKRPFETTYQWGMFAADSEMWELFQSLDERGERESALKATIKARFDIEPPAAEYVKTGSDYIGRSVSRTYNLGKNKKKKVTGKIVSWLPPQDDDLPLWHVLHPDGDEEDLEEHEVKACLISDEEAARSSSSVMSINSAPLKLESKTDKNGKKATIQADGEDVEVPELVKNFRFPSGRSYPKFKDTQLGLNGLKAEMLKAHSLLHRSVSNTKQWVRSVSEATTLKEMRSLLQELEVIFHDLQQIPDVDDNEEEEREKREDREKMKEEGWDFEKNQYISKRIRRFFTGYPKSDGTIIAFLEGDKNEGENWWRMVYDDLDEEDLDESTVIRGIKHFEEDAKEDDRPDDRPDDNLKEDDVEDENDDVELEAIDIEVNDGDGDVYHPDDLIDKSSNISNVLWPTNGVRKRWKDALDKSNTISEVSLSLKSLLEYGKAFGVYKEDPTEERLLYGGARILTSKSPTKSTSKKRKANDDNIYADPGRVRRAATKKDINYAEY